MNLARIGYQHLPRSISKYALLLGGARLQGKT